MPSAEVVLTVFIDFIIYMTVKETLHQKLVANFSPESIEIIDESHKHRGHAGFKPGGETHFRINMVSGAFASKNRVERQRMVYEVLREELQNQVHALSLYLQTPEEVSPITPAEAV